jgi:diguanylate cyclase (GGDEF)-like protein
MDERPPAALQGTRPSGPVSGPRAIAAARRFFRVFDESAETDADAPLFRARQLQAVLKITPLAMAANVANAIVLCVVLWDEASHGFLLAWTGAIAGMAAAGLSGWRRARDGRPRPGASPRALRRAALQAALLGLVWGVLPMALFAHATPDGRFVIGMVIAGMICAGGFVLASVPWAATSYVLVMCLASAYALAQWEGVAAEGMAAMLLAYGAVMIYAAWNHAKTLGARLMAEARAEHQNEVIGLLLRDFEDHASDLLWELDPRGRFTRVSDKLAAAFAIPPARLQRMRASLLLRGMVPVDHDAHAQWEALVRLMAQRLPFSEGLLTISVRAEQAWWTLSARPLADRSGEFAGWRGVASDITEQQLAHRRLRWLAHNDSLTGLVNRAQFREQLQAFLPRTEQEEPLAVITFDLDSFKQINDTQGHAAGDALLKAFGARLLSVARRHDTVARLGGDEFAMLVRGVGAEAGIRPLLQRLLVALKGPADAGASVPTVAPAVALRASMGVAFAPRDGTDVDDLLNHADIALYSAKRAGGGSYRVFDPVLAEADRQQTTREQALRGALERREFYLVYQPQASTAEGQITGFEALLRWRHPELGEISPVEFVGIAESARLMTEIGGWVLAEACRQARAWGRPLRISVNVSATQLGSPGFVDEVQAATRGLAPGQVELEITESAMVADVDAAVRTLQALRARGCRIALDDFGTGYSALGYLRRFAFDTLKIDRSFVQGLDTNREMQVIVDTILAMARALGMDTVAEGVETPAEARLLQEKGCHTLQGYLIARPMAAQDVGRFMETWRPQPPASTWGSGLQA